MLNYPCAKASAAFQTRMRMTPPLPIWFFSFILALFGCVIGVICVILCHFGIVDNGYYVFNNEFDFKCESDCPRHTKCAPTSPPFSTFIFYNTGTEIYTNNVFIFGGDYNANGFVYCENIKKMIENTVTTTDTRSRLAPRAKGIDIANCCTELAVPNVLLDIFDIISDRIGFAYDVNNRNKCDLNKNVFKNVHYVLIWFVCLNCFVCKSCFFVKIFVCCVCFFLYFWWCICYDIDFIMLSIMDKTIMTVLFGMVYMIVATFQLFMNFCHVFHLFSFCYLCCADDCSCLDSIWKNSFAPENLLTSTFSLAKYTFHKLNHLT